MKTHIGTVNTFATGQGGGNSPDSITHVGNDIFVEYGNKADSTGAGGLSQIVEYDRNGNVLGTYDLAGSVDGLKYDPNNHYLYALQNQDGNSTLTLINPRTGEVSAPQAYTTSSGSRGYDDIVFEGNKVFLSYTNPVGNGDPVIVELHHGNFPIGPLQTSPVLASDATGTNTVTGQRHQAVPLTDPDSLKAAPNGDLILSSGGDGVIVDVRNPGERSQSVSFTQVTDAQGKAASGLDDVIKTDAQSGTFTLTDTSGNKVSQFKASNLNPNDYYASVASLGGFGEINPSTGVFKLLVASAGAHGLLFQPSDAGMGGHGGHGDHFASAHHPSVSPQAAALAQAITDQAPAGETMTPASAGNGQAATLVAPHHHFGAAG